MISTSPPRTRTAIIKAEIGTPTALANAAAALSSGLKLEGSVTRNLVVGVPMLLGIADRCALPASSLVSLTPTDRKKFHQLREKLAAFEAILPGALGADNMDEVRFAFGSSDPDIKPHVDEILGQLDGPLSAQLAETLPQLMDDSIAKSEALLRDRVSHKAVAALERDLAITFTPDEHADLVAFFDGQYAARIDQWKALRAANVSPGALIDVVVKAAIDGLVALDHLRSRLHAAGALA